MLARNPKTGGTIRVMKSDSSIWKNRKTLVLMKDAPTAQTAIWSRWDIAIATVDPGLLAWNPQVVILIEETPEIILWLKTPDAKNTRFILISRKVVDAFGEDAFQDLGLGNVLCLDEFADMYPFIGAAWDGTVEDALVCASIVFRYQRLVGVTAEKGQARISQVALKPVNLEVLLESETNAPEPLVLIQQYYKPPQSTRAKELDKCLKKNLENPLIDRIYLFVESKDLKLPKHDKLVLMYKKPRITYADCIELIQTKIGKGHLVAFANADIYLDASWSNLWATNIKDVCLGLLRWEEEGNDGTSTMPELYGPRADSQDTWVVHSDSVLERTWNLDPFKIPFGTPGCDNAILVEFLRQKFRIVNPAMSLRTIHVHKSQIRSYDPKDIVDRPTYMFVDPTGIHELNPLTQWTGWASKLVNHEALDRPLKATTPKTLGIFCSQMNRDLSFVWTADGLNTYIAPSDQDHQISMDGGAFVSVNGLVYRHTDLCVGKTDVQKEIWSENQISHLMPAQKTESMMCFPLEVGWLDEPALYTLYYLSRVIKQHKETPEASFWCKRSNTLLSAFKLLKWSEPRGHLLQYTQNTQAFSNKVVGRTAHSVRVMPSDIDALRSNLYGEWIKDPILDAKPILLLVCDEAHIKDDLLTMIESLSNDMGYTVKVVYANADASVWASNLSGASKVILSTSLKHVKVPTWAWLWMAPLGCKVLELQEEREPSDSLIHLSAAAKLDWTLLQYPRATPEGFKKIIMKEIGKWFNADSNTASSAGSQLPLLLVPPKSMKFGFFGHKGDSFRELADMWAEKGFVELKEDPVITQCWLYGVGKTLLYDRPTWAWLEKSSANEQNYKVCLAGNPNASEKPNAKPWIFWPRHPRLVEAQAALDTKGFREREDKLVFYGRIENDAQGLYRQDVAGWSNLCDKFSMPVGAKQPYALGPEEYLAALRNARFGLCLRGYGPKCNREIELLAMGTVPLIVTGVDISGYADPLIDGVHVICVSDAEDAKTKMASINAEQWTKMSKEGQAWWKRNSSVEGSWQRTNSFNS